MMMAKVLQHKMAEKRTPEDIDRFENLLKKKLLEEFNYFCLMVDYDPCTFLWETAEQANCDINMGLPWKTSMFFYDDGSVWVSYGYGAPRTKILVEEEQS